MKKLFIVLILGGIALAFTSCKKECVCNGTVSGTDGWYMETENVSNLAVGQMKKSECNNYAVSKSDLIKQFPQYSHGGIAITSINVSCKLQ
jgi:hypothetical protein